MWHNPARMPSCLRAGFLLAIAFATATILAAAPQTFKQLYDAHDWFGLRDAVARAKQTPELYRGAVAYAFHEPVAAQRSLRHVIAVSPKSDDAIEAHSLLVSVAQMNGDYPGTLAEIKTLQKIVPDPSGLENGAAFFMALAAFPKQFVAKPRSTTVATSVRGGNLFVPASINGTSAQCILDTGANFSVMSEGDARRFGLTVHEAPGSHGTDAAGGSVAFRVAFAERVSIGGFDLRNVTFLVARDDQQPFIDLPAASRSALGIPVLVALGSMKWHVDGRLEIGGPRVAGVRRDANLCFDGADLHAAAEYQGRPIDAFIDTGAEKSRLTTRFGADFPQALANAKTAVSTVRGVGGSAKARVAILERLTVRLGGRDLTLDSVETFLEQRDKRPDRFHLWAGFDLFRRAQTVTIDFRSMRMAVE